MPTALPTDPRSPAAIQRALRSGFASAVAQHAGGAARLMMIAPGIFCSARAPGAIVLQVLSSAVRLPAVVETIN